MHSVSRPLWLVRDPIGSPMVYYGVYIGGEAPCPGVGKTVLVVVAVQGAPT